jgi:CubicO group peptidase (beta-lactamase class C family)
MLQSIDNWCADGDVSAVAAAVVTADGVTEMRTAGAAEERSLFALASVSKPLVALAALVAAEEHAIDLDQPVASVLEGYGTSGRAQITPRHLLSHASGLPEAARGVAPLDVIPEYPTGTRRVYSNEGFHVLAELITAATGIGYAQYVTEALLEPLGIDAFLPLPESEYGRAIEVTDPGLSAPGVPLFNAPAWRQRASAAGGIFATVGGVARIVQLVLEHGGPLLSAETIADLQTVQYPGIPGGIESFPKLHCPDWGLGLNVRGAGGPHWLGDAVSPQTLSHFGASGTLVWIDPAAGCGLVCLANRGTYSAWMLRPGRWLDLTAEVAGAAV